MTNLSTVDPIAIGNNDAFVTNRYRLQCRNLHLSLESSCCPHRNCMAAMSTTVKGPSGDHIGDDVIGCAIEGNPIATMVIQLQQYYYVIVTKGENTNLI